MFTKIYIFGLLLALSWLSFAFIGGSDSVQSDFQTDINIQITSSSQPNVENTVDDRLELLELDTMCIESCWSTFIPEQTEMTLVFDWFGEKFPSISDYQRDHSAPNNFIGINLGGNLAFRVFTDAQSPPTLRSFYLSIFPTNRREPSYLGDISLEHIEFLMPSNMLSQYGSEPEYIMIRNNQNFYTILLDFKDIGVAVAYKGNVVSDSACINDNINEINWLVYGSSEISAIRLLNEINQYNGIETPISFVNSEGLIKLYSNNSEIQEITEQLLNSECINLERYGLAE